MDVVNLAVMEIPWWGFIFALPIASGVPLSFFSWYLFREPKFRGPALTGTAQVLSQKCLGTESSNGWLPENMWWIRLRTEVPGRQPYNVTVWKRGGGAPGRGSTVGVQVDSANPRNVRIGYSLPSIPQVRSFSANIPASAGPVQSLAD